MKKQFWRKSGQEQAAKCPVCGKYMEKENGIVIPAISPVFTDRLHAAKCLNYWYCRDCNESLKR